MSSKLREALSDACYAMIKITNDIDGKKYELVKESHMCDGCVFLKDGILSGCENTPEFNRVAICAKLHGIWKEVRDAD